MKHCILSVAFTVLFAAALCQTKKPDSTQKHTKQSNKTSSAILIQEKLWPVPYSNFRNKASIIIKPATAIEIRTRL